jgi:hypothetical protein
MSYPILSMLKLHSGNDVYADKRVILLPVMYLLYLKVLHLCVVNWIYIETQAQASSATIYISEIPFTSM